MKESTCATSAVTRAKSPIRWRSTWRWIAASRRAPNSGLDWRCQRRMATVTGRSKRRSDSVWRPPKSRQERGCPLRPAPSRLSDPTRPSRRPAVAAAARRRHARIRLRRRPLTVRRRRTARSSVAATLRSSTGVMPKWKQSSATWANPNRVTCAYTAEKCTPGSTGSRFT